MGFKHIFEGLPTDSSGALEAALRRVQMGLGPHARKQYKRQFKLLLAFVVSRNCLSVIIPP